MTSNYSKFQKLIVLDIRTHFQCETLANNLSKVLFVKNIFYKIYSVVFKTVLFKNRIYVKSLLNIRYGLISLFL